MFDTRKPVRTLLSVFIVAITLSPFGYGGRNMSALAFQPDVNETPANTSRAEGFPGKKTDLKTLSMFFQRLQKLNGELVDLIGRGRALETVRGHETLGKLWSRAKKIYLPGISSACARVSAERSLEELRRNILLVRSIEHLSRQKEDSRTISYMNTDFPLYQTTEGRFISEYSHMFQSYACLGYPKSGVNPETWSIRGPLALSTTLPGPPE